MNPPANEAMEKEGNATTDPEAGASKTEQPTGLVSNFKKLLKTVRESEFSSQWLDLTKSTVQQKALLMLGVAAGVVDPLFFYIPMINNDSKCLRTDRKLGVISISLRSVVDLLHLVLWSFYYKNKARSKLSDSAAPAVSSAPGEENMQEGEIPPGKTHSLSPCNSKATGRLIEILCVLPLPQATTLAILIMKGDPRSVHAVTLLKFSILIQFVLRAFRVFSSFHEATAKKKSFNFWIGAGFNLLLFVIASHVLGAFWYLLSVGRTMDCWKRACRSRVGCKIGSLYCGGPKDNNSYLDDSCPIQQATNSSPFDFGIYLSALDSKIVGSTNFPLKLSYSFWWGLRNLSSMGQNLTSSAYVWEICFSICISILGLILVSLLIGNMQVLFQYQTTEELKIMKENKKLVAKKHNDLWKWLLFRRLPIELKKRILSCVKDKWLKTPEVNIETALKCLPKDLRKMLKDNIIRNLEKQVGELFKIFRESAEISRMKPMVFKEGDPVFEKCMDKMVFIISGELTKQDGQGRKVLTNGEYCGGELLVQIASGSYDNGTSSSENRNPLTADIKAKSKVEAMVMDANDLRCLVLKQSEYKKGRIKELILNPKAGEPSRKRSRGLKKSKQG